MLNQGLNKKYKNRKNDILLFFTFLSLNKWYGYIFSDPRPGVHPPPRGFHARLLERDGHHRRLLCAHLLLPHYCVSAFHSFRSFPILNSGIFPVWTFEVKNTFTLFSSVFWWQTFVGRLQINGIYLMQLHLTEGCSRHQ